MSDRETRIWRGLLRGWLAGLALWYAAFLLLDNLADRPAMLYAGLAGLAALAAIVLWLRARRKRTAGVRAELRRVSKTKWTREG